MTTVFDDSHVHKIKGISEHCPRDEMFFHKRENRERSVEEYYETTYHQRLRHPELPCVDCSSRHKPVMIPPEFARCESVVLVAEKTDLHLTGIES